MICHEIKTLTRLQKSKTTKTILKKVHFAVGVGFRIWCIHSETFFLFLKDFEMFSVALMAKIVISTALKIGPILNNQKLGQLIQFILYLVESEYIFQIAPF